jgi:hypothetical protein
VNGNCEFVARCRSTASEEAVGIANQKAILLESLKGFKCPVIVRNVREIVLCNSR